ncbi:MAG TPA: Gfo/Idh/MocA family oxidoreductase [Acidimicrobiales bacterium]|nr:Gfo/Idh/MocA family oxidoreductase [Acidimicrobiales bacterium]
MTVRIAVVGIGYWGSKHLRVLSSLPEVTEVVCVDPRLPGPSWPTGLRWFTELGSALPEVDAVVISTPPTSHAAVALEAIAAGKHVLVEKPFTTTVADGRALIRAARDAGVVLMVGHTYVHNSVVRQLRALIAERELGDLFYLDSARLNLGLYRPDVSVVWDLAAHDVAIMNYLLDDVPDVVAARAGHAANPRFDDIAYLWLEFHRTKVVASIHVSWLDPCKVRRLTVVGSEAMAVFDDLSMDERLKIYDKGVTFDRDDRSGDAPLSYRYGNVVSPYVEVDEPLVVEDGHFVECILEGRAPLTGGGDGLDVVRVLTAADTSLRENRIVELAETDEVEEVPA